MYNAWALFCDDNLPILSLIFDRIKFYFIDVQTGEKYTP